MLISLIYSVTMPYVVQNTLLFNLTTIKPNSLSCRASIYWHLCLCLNKEREQKATGSCWAQSFKAAEYHRSHQTWLQSPLQVLINVGNARGFPSLTFCIKTQVQIHKPLLLLWFHNDLLTVDVLRYFRCCKKQDLFPNNPILQQDSH